MDSEENVETEEIVETEVVIAMSAIMAEPEEEALIQEDLVEMDIGGKKK